MKQLTELTDTELIEEFEIQTQYAADDFADYAAGGTSTAARRREQFITDICEEMTRRRILMIIQLSDKRTTLTNERIFKMTKQELYDKVSKLVKIPVVKDFTYLSDWIEEGDTDDMTPEEIAAEWDELSEMETDENTQ